MGKTSHVAKRRKKRRCNWIGSDPEDETRPRTPCTQQPVSQASPQHSTHQPSEDKSTQSGVVTWASVQPVEVKDVPPPSMSPISSGEDVITPITRRTLQPRSSTPCEHVRDSGYSSSSCRKPEVTDHVINFAHQSHDLPWHSHSSDSSLDTSTLDYKRGNHRDLDPDECIRELIRKEGVRHRLPRWQRKQRCTLHVLADSRFGEWPVGDQFCKLTYFQHLPTSQWMRKLRTREIIIKAHSVILYLQKLRYTEHVTPLRNKISQICRAVRSVNEDARIFLCDLIPSDSPLENEKVVKYNRDLFVATQHE